MKKKIKYKNIYDWVFTIKFIVIIFLLYLILTGVVGFIFIYSDAENKLGSVSGSLFAGLLVAIIQLVVSYQDYTRNEAFRKLKLLEIFDTRNEREVYGEYLSTASREVRIMGDTASRFFNDFANTALEASESNRIVLELLRKKVEIKVLLPKKEYLDEDKRVKYDLVKNKVSELKANRHNNIKVKYFDHTPNHSIFMVDDSCIVGPIFPNIESQFTHSLKIHTSSDMATIYLKYFDEEWENAHE